jgi:hypothetical protein
VRLALIVVVVCACADSEPEPVRVTTHSLPEWAELPLPADPSKIARPQPWQPDGRPTLMIFSAAWCPPCKASLLTDIAMARAYGDKLQIGIGLVDNADEDFMQFPMAHLLSDVPVWSASSVKAMAKQCGAQAIPLACLIDHGRVVFRGPTVSAAHLLQAYADGKLAATLEQDTLAHATAAEHLVRGVSRDDIPDILEATRHDPGWQGLIAYQLASKRDATPLDALLAVELSHDAVAAEGGLDYAHLDTYALALSKANLPEGAAMVSWRVLAICATVKADCIVEKHRAYAYIYYAKETGLRWHSGQR